MSTAEETNPEVRQAFKQSALAKAFKELQILEI